MTSTKKSILCRNGNCKKKATTFVKSESKDRVFKYYFCTKHWLDVLKEGLIY